MAPISKSPEDQHRWLTLYSVWWGGLESSRPGLKSWLCLLPRGQGTEEAGSTSAQLTPEQVLVKTPFPLPPVSFLSAEEASILNEQCHPPGPLPPGFQFVPLFWQQTRVSGLPRDGLFLIRLLPVLLDGHGFSERAIYLLICKGGSDRGQNQLLFFIFDKVIKAIVTV